MRVSRGHFQRRIALYGPHSSWTLWVNFAGKLGPLWAPPDLGPQGKPISTAAVFAASMPNAADLEAERTK
jgi:hypothetical protein